MYQYYLAASRGRETRSIAINDPVAWVSVSFLVCLSVWLSRDFTRLRCANTAEQIEVLLGVEFPTDTINIVLHGISDFRHRFNAAFAKLLWPLVRLSAALCGINYIY